MNLCWLLVKAKTKFLFDPGKKILAAGLIKRRDLTSSLADWTTIFGTILLFNPEIFPNNVNFLDHHIFRSVLILSLIDEKF